MIQLRIPVFNFTFYEDTIDKGKVLIPEVLGQAFLTRLHTECPMINAVRRDYSADLAQQGDVVQIPKLGSLVTYDKVANTPVTPQNPSMTHVDVALTEHKEVTFILEDVAAVEGMAGVKEEYIGDACKALADDVELMLLGEYGEAGDTLEWDDTDGDSISTSILAARSKIVVDNKAGYQPRFLVIRDIAELLKVNEFISRDYVTVGSLAEGAIGSLYGFAVMEEPLTLQATSPTRTHRMAYARDAIALVTRALPTDLPGVNTTMVNQDGVGCRVTQGYNINLLAMQATIDILFGVATVMPIWSYELIET
jgi:hypothetical protein